MDEKYTAGLAAFDQDIATARAWIEQGVKITRHALAAGEQPEKLIATILARLESNYSGEDDRQVEKALKFQLAVAIVELAERDAG